MWSKYLVTLLFLHLFNGLCAADIIDDVDDLPTRTFDFIVIGGGTAGNVVANRLTENPGVSVLVLEAGGSNENVLLSMVPAFCLFTSGSALDWNYTAQLDQSGRTAQIPRGFILGGSSSINCMAYTRGSSDDWDRYAMLTRQFGWSWAQIQPYIRKNERFTQPVDHHNTTGQFDPSVHGFHGINSVTLPGLTHRFDELVIESSKIPGTAFPFNLDSNSGNQIGISWAQSTVFNGQRSSSATSYLSSQFRQRPNLHILLHAHATRILQANTSHLSFDGVQFTQDAGDSFEFVSATKEIIISAGSIGTPQLLMNSGIGDSNALSKLGVHTILDLPSVGQNLTEQPVVRQIWSINSTDSLEVIFGNATLYAEALQQWNETRTGPFAVSPLSTVGWLRLPGSLPIFETINDPAAGPHTAHFEIIFTSNGGGSSTTSVTTMPALLTPISRGFVKLNSSNPLDHPLINYNFFDSEFDLVALRESIRIIRRFMASTPFDGFILSDSINATTDDELDDYIRSHAGGATHLVGTASMSPIGADWGVVDPDLKLKGAKGVRVVDASVLPLVPAAHTQASVYIVAERASDVIKTAWSL